MRLPTSITSLRERLTAAALVGFERTAHALRERRARSRQARAGVVCSLGWRADQQGRAKEAIDHYHHALRLDPQMLHAQLGLARCYIKELQPERSAASARAVLAIDPFNHEAQLYAGTAAYLRQAFEPAAEHFAAALMTLPMESRQRATALDYLGDCQAALGRELEAARNYQEAVGAGHHDSYAKLVGLAESMLRGAAPEHAYAAYEALFAAAEAVSKGVDEQLRGRLWRQVGTGFWQLGDQQSARRCFDRGRRTATPGRSTVTPAAKELPQ